MTADAPMYNKVVVLTGGTSGIGRVAAVRLAAMGARVVLIARSGERANATLAELRKAAPRLDHAFHLADLSRIAEAKGVAEEIAAAEPRIDVLVNNAGALYNRCHVTPDGLEATFATNHMAYFVITAALLRRLEAAAPARVVSTASAAHRGAKLDFENLQLVRGYRGLRAYARSKLCNILFTRELSRRLAGSGVTANCLHPGFVATRFAEGSGGMVGGLARLAKTFAMSPSEGAKTLVHLAASPEVERTSGGYFIECRLATPSPQARDADAARRLWTVSAELAGLPRG